MTHTHANECEEWLALANFSFDCVAVPAFCFTSRGAIYRVNQAACDFLGYSAAQLKSLHIFDIDPSASPATWPNHWHKLKTQRCMTFTSHHLTATGQLKPVEVTVNFFTVGEQEFNVAFAKDLTAQLEAEQSLRETQERHSLVIESANDGIWDWDIQTQTISFSERLYSMLGLCPKQDHQSLEDWLIRVHPDDRQKVEAKLHDYRTGKIEQLDTEFRMLHERGHYLSIHCRGKGLHDFNGQMYRIAGSMTDITERRQAQNQLLYDALHDPLTGLPNRKLLLDHLDKLISKGNDTEPSKFAVLFIDLDRFKRVNDSLGHRSGDQLLLEIGTRLRQCISPDNIVARLSGDEFIVVLRSIVQSDTAIEVATRILNELTTPVYLDDQIIYPSVSLGIALSDFTRSTAGIFKPVSAEDYLQRADIAMYQAKISSHAKYALFSEEMQETIYARLQLEVELQSAIEREEFELVYQPIMSLDRHELQGFEALIRWQHPVRGCISPDVFIPIAEEAGLIMALGRWVLQTACRQMVQWQKLPSCDRQLFVTINLASSQIMHPEFVALMDRILQETGVNPRNIKLEITESAIIKNKEFARSQILALKDRHIKICMDDFGTGYSSLGYLHQLPIDCLKIDQSFVQQIKSNQDNPEIIRAILAIAHSLNMSIIAEGIETEQQATLLREVGCPCGQGYFFDRPLSVWNASQRIMSFAQPLSLTAFSAHHLDRILAS